MKQTLSSHALRLVDWSLGGGSNCHSHYRGVWQNRGVVFRGLAVIPLAV